MAKKKQKEQISNEEAQALVQSGEAEVPAEAVVNEAEVKAEEPKQEPKAKDKKLVAKKGFCFVLPKHNMSIETDIHLETGVKAEIPQDVAEKLVNDTRGPMVEIL